MYGFDVLCTPTSLLDDKGRGEVRGGVGLPTFAVVLADVLVVLVVGVVFCVRSRSCLHPLAVNRQVVGTHGVEWCVWQAVLIPGSGVVRGDGRR